jgi:hypothetical protein
MMEEREVAPLPGEAAVNNGSSRQGFLAGLSSSIQRHEMECNKVSP